VEEFKASEDIKDNCYGENIEVLAAYKEVEMIPSLIESVTMCSMGVEEYPGRRIAHWQQRIQWSLAGS
jgi:hypothetical protein